MGSSTHLDCTRADLHAPRAVRHIPIRVRTILMSEEVDPMAEAPAREQEAEETPGLTIDLGSVLEAATPRPQRDLSVVFDVDNLSVHYGEHQAVRDVTL